MFLKKVLNQPNLVGSMLIALMVCCGFVYTFAFDGFNVRTVTDSEVEAWLGKASGQENYNKDCNNNACVSSWAGCPGNGCTDCTSNGDNIRNCAIDKRGNSKCGRSHSGCGTSSKPKCPFNSGTSKKYCANGGNSCPDGTESPEAKKCNRK